MDSGNWICRYANSSAPYSIYNIGNGNQVKLLDFIEAMENSLGIKAEKNFMDMQPEDVYQTYAAVEDLFKVIGHKPAVSIAEGVGDCVKWYKEFYN